MVTRRNMLLGSIAFAACADLAAGAESVMSSTVFDWNAMQAKPTAAGSTRQVCNQPTATLENLEIHITTLDPGKSPHPPHRHPNEELVILQHGTLEALENGEWKRVGPGSVIFSASNQLHGLRNPGSEPAGYHVINFKTAATPAPAKA
jgi:XRE family transcriptional regulator, regulator of sulfur utilization